MHPIDLLAPGRVVIDAGITSKKRLLERLAQLLADGQGDQVERNIFDSLCAREKLGSTALGHGIAIPHGRSQSLAGACACFVRLATPIDFGAPDGQPVDLLFALGVPEHFTNQHLLLLSQLAEMFSHPEFTSRLRAAPDTIALHRLLSDWHATAAAA
ncbi:MAG: PTS sugar transporter subunit IIA [Lysobacteraceae bacterium]